MPEIPKKQPHRAYMPDPPPAHKRRISNTKFYKSQAWVKTSQLLRLNRPECEVSSEPTPGELVDHIIPINQGGAKMDWENLMVMCNEKHNKKSGMESHKPILVEWVLNKDGDKIPKNREDIIKLLQ